MEQKDAQEATDTHTHEGSKRSRFDGTRLWQYCHVRTALSRSATTSRWHSPHSLPEANQGLQRPQMAEHERTQQ